MPCTAPSCCCPPTLPSPALIPPRLRERGAPDHSPLLVNNLELLRGSLVSLIPTGRSVAAATDLRCAARETPPLPCGSTAFVAKTLPFLAGLQRDGAPETVLSSLLSPPALSNLANHALESRALSSHLSPGSFSLCLSLSLSHAREGDVGGGGQGTTRRRSP